MDYDLAKRLKKAGFPQEGLGFFGAENRAVGSRHASQTFDVYVPSLAELIDARGDHFSSLVRQSTGPTGVTWLASGRDMRPVSGATPVEAVSRLWLACNKKP